MNTSKQIQQEGDIQRVFDFSIDMLGIANFQGYFTRLNPAWENTLGYALDELMEHPYLDFIHPDDVERTLEEAKKLSEGATMLHFENRYRCKDGSYKWLSWRANPDIEAALIYFVARDVTAVRQLNEELEQHRNHLEDLVVQRTHELERINRAYRTLSAGNQLLVRATDEKRLLQDVCEVIVDIGGYRMAWVGYKVEDEAKTVRPMAWAGIGGDKIQQSSLSWGDDEQGQSPIGTAIRTAIPTIFQNLANDPYFYAYRKWAHMHGHQSGAAFPLISSSGVTLGAVSVFAAEPDAFGAQETDLLAEMVGDLAFGIETVRARALHDLGQQQLEQQHRRLKSVYDVGRMVNSTLKLTDILDFVTDEAMRVTHAERGLTLVVDKVEGKFVQHSLRGFSPEELAVVEANALRLDQGLNGQVYQTGQIICIDDVRDHPHYVAHSDQTLSEMVIPIIRNREVIGNISLQSTRLAAFRDADVVYLQALAEQSSVAITNAQLFAELESYSQFLEQAITERTADLRSTKDRVETILTSIGDALMVLGVNGRIKQVNPAFERQTGYPASEAEGHDHHDLLNLKFGSKGDYQNTLEGLGFGQVWQGQTVVVRKSGSRYDADMTVAPVRDTTGKINLLVAIIRDISPLKAVERAKDEFVSNVSHELRTPITGMKLNFGMLGRDPARQAVYLERLGREIDRLNALIEDLLRLSRLEHGKVELVFAPTDLNALGAQMVADRTPMAETRELSLRFEPLPDLPLIEVDSGLLGQALSVLLTNALNYTPAGGEVAVSAVTDRARIGLCVADTGPGISADEQAKLFERFFRGTAGRASGAPGTGLGLSIAKQIIEQHRGKLEVVSEGIAGKGSAFTLWIPTE